MKHQLFFLSLLTATVLCAQISLVPGSRMQEPQADWLTVKPVEAPLPSDQNTFVDVIIMVDMLRPDALQVLNMVNRLSAEIHLKKNEQLRITAVAANDRKTTEQVLKSTTLKFTIPIGSDRKGETFKTFSISSVPFAYVAKNRSILWSGHPVDLEYIIESAFNGTFSESSFKQLRVFRNEMQTAIQSGLPEVAGQTAEKALAVFPTDMLALQTRLYAFQQRGRYKEAAAFLGKHLAKYPAADRPGIRMLYLDMIIRSGNYQNWDKIVEETIRKTAGQPEKELNLAAFLLTQPPLLRCPVKAILPLANRAVNGLKNNPNLLADAYEILARANYAACRLDQAIQAQRKAVVIRKNQNTPAFERTQQLLKFYISLKQLKND